MYMVEDFAFCVQQNRFFHKATGFIWKVGGINSVCEVVADNGKFIKPSDWIRKCSRVESMPERKYRSPLDR